MSGTTTEAHGLTSVEAIEAGMDEKPTEFTGHGRRVFLAVTDQHTRPRIALRITCPIGGDH
jgi:hypothetical protein